MKFSLDIFEDEDFKKFIREQVIVYKTNNGIKVIDEDYTQEVFKHRSNSGCREFF